MTDGSVPMAHTVCAMVETWKSFFVEQNVVAKNNQRKKSKLRKQRKKKRNEREKRRTIKENYTVRIFMVCKWDTWLNYDYSHSNFNSTQSGGGVEWKKEKEKERNLGLRVNCELLSRRVDEQSGSESMSHCWGWVSKEMGERWKISCEDCEREKKGFLR